MRTISLIILAACTFMAMEARAQAPEWTDAWDIGTDGSEFPTRIGTDARGNLYVTGYAANFPVFDPYSATGQFLGCFQPDGTELWARTVFSINPSSPCRMAIDAMGNTYLAATFINGSIMVDLGARDTLITTDSSTGLIVMSYDAGGNLRWLRTGFGADTMSVEGLAVQGSRVWLGGTFQGVAGIGGTRLQSAGGSDICIAQFDTSGTFIGAVRSGGPAGDRCNGLGADSSGDATLLGTFGGTAAFGDTSLVATSNATMVLARYRPDFSVAWARADGTPTFDPFTVILAVDRSGAGIAGLSYTGTFSVDGRTYPARSESDALVVRYGPDGRAQWEVPFGGSFMQEVDGLGTDSQGNVYVGGFSQALPDGEAFLARISRDGIRQWQATDSYANAICSTYGGPICVDSAGVIHMAGAFSGITRFGTHVIASQGSTPTSSTGWDVYVASLAQSSSVERSERAEPTAAPVALRRSGDMLVVSPAADGAELLGAELYSVLGRRAADRQRAPARGETITFDLGALPSGAYLVVARTAAGVVSLPFIHVR
ncbi:MAG: hypothetical protein JST22_01725 [Bacteroidetes bacterium]|nr:hypothetical protein [Bacteroidota bacterium]